MGLLLAIRKKYVRVMPVLEGHDQAMGATQYFALFAKYYEQIERKVLGACIANFKMKSVVEANRCARYYKSYRAAFNRRQPGGPSPVVTRAANCTTTVLV